MNSVSLAELATDAMAVDTNRALVFGVQAGISAITIVVSVYMMMRSRDNIQTFLPILTSVTAYWLPAPKLGVASNKPVVAAPTSPQAPVPAQEKPEPSPAAPSSSKATMEVESGPEAA
jgi:hypothetical protein